MDELSKYAITLGCSVAALIIFSMIMISVWVNTAFGFNQTLKPEDDIQHYVWDLKLESCPILLNQTVIVINDSLAVYNACMQEDEETLGVQK